MSEARPFLFKVRVHYVDVLEPAPGYAPGLRPYYWAPDALPDGSQGRVFDVYAAERQAPEPDRRLSFWRLAGPLSEDLWAREQYLNPKDLPGHDLDPGTPAFGNALVFCDAGAAAVRVAVRTENPPALDPDATPDWGKGAHEAGRFGLWRITSANRPTADPMPSFTKDYVLGWPDVSLGARPPSCPLLELARDLVLVTPGAAYLRAFPGAFLWAQDFTAIDISGEDYSHLPLEGVDFSGSKLTGAILQKSDLSRAAFVGATLAGADLGGAVLIAAQFEQSGLQGATLTAAELADSRFVACAFASAELGPAIFYKADLSRVGFVSAGLAGVNFRFARLEATKFERCDLQGAWVIDAALTGTRFTDCDFTGAEFRGTVALDATFEHCTFSGANLGAAQWLGTTFVDCKFPDADFSGAKFSGAVFKACDLSGARWTEAPHWGDFPEPRSDFTGSKVAAAFLGAAWNNLVLTGVEWSGLPARIEGLNARNAVLTGMRLTGLDLANADFTDATMCGVGLSGANLTQARFTRADLRGADLSGCQLMRADFTNASLQGGDGYDPAILSDAALMDARFDGADLSYTLFVRSCFWGESASVAGATISATDFSNAYLVGVSFADVARKTLSGARFSGACLVNASFAGTHCGSIDGVRSSFAGACLLGADFTDAILGDSDLSGAAVAVERGEITAPVYRGWPLHASLEPPIEYLPTRGLETATTAQSICPSGVTGPCEGAKLRNGLAVPASWGIVPRRPGAPIAQKTSARFVRTGHP